MHTVQERLSVIMTNSEKRWIEIKFAFLAFDLYRKLNDYIFVSYYIELLAELAKIEKTKALRLLQKVHQVNAIRPSNAEYVKIATENGQSENKVCSAIKISKETFRRLKNSETYGPSTIHVSEEELNTMIALLDAHKRLKECGLK